MANWTIQRAWSAGPTPGTDADAAFAFELERDGQTVQTTVEYAAPSSLASSRHARSTVSGYLNEDVPPRRLIVSRDGNVSVREPGTLA